DLATHACYDFTPPTIFMNKPLAGDGLWGTVSIDVTASDNVGLRNLRLEIDSVEVQVYTPPAPTAALTHTFLWDSTTVSNGRHNITVRTNDYAGNGAGEGTSDLWVAN